MGRGALAALAIAGAWAGVEAAPPDEALQARAAARVNAYRAQAGLAAVEPLPAAARAAGAHAAYLERHVRGGVRLSSAHRETPGTEGFTGENGARRVAAQGFFGGVAEVISWDEVEPEAAIDHLMNTVYHRVGLLDPRARFVGFGAARDAVVLMAWGQRPDRKMTLTHFPADGATDVPPRFPGGELPEPLPGVEYPVGPPLSVGGSRGPPRLLSARLEGPEGEVPVRLLQRPDVPRAELLGPWVFVMPMKPLRPHSPYEVRVRVKDAGRRRTLNWAFTTGEAVPGERRARVLRRRVYEGGATDPSRVEGALDADAVRELVGEGAQVEVLTGRVKRFTLSSQLVNPGDAVTLEAQVEASDPGRARLVWKADGEVLHEGPFRPRPPPRTWIAGKPGTHKLELWVTYPGHSSPAGRRGVFLQVRDPNRARELSKPLGLSFEPPAPWTPGQAVRLVATPLRLEGVTYTFKVDGRQLAKTTEPIWTWRADGRHDHVFEVRFKFPGGSATRKVTQVKR